MQMHTGISGIRHLFKNPASGLAALAICAISSTSAHAGITFILKNQPQPGEQNILFGAKETGTSIFGVTNKTGTLVTFSSSVDTLLQNSSGQAMIFNDAGGNLSDITVTPSESFTDFIVDLNKAPHAGSTINITVHASDGTFTDSFTAGTGSNFVTILATDGETMSSINYASANGGWEQFKQPRISGVPGFIPEPSTWAMMLLGFAGLGYVGFRRAKKESISALA
jgi:hypothetical protein